jgi:hypothetical protein
MLTTDEVAVGFEGCVAVGGGVCDGLGDGVSDGIGVDVCPSFLVWSTQETRKAAAANSIKRSASRRVNFFFIGFPYSLNIHFPTAQPFHHVRITMVEETAGFSV